MNILHSNATAEWYTPSPLIELIRHTLGSIDLDPCSNEAANKVVRATEYLTKADNGLEHNWGGNVFVNPPSKCDSPEHAKRCNCKLPRKFMTQLFHEFYEGELNMGSAVYLGFNLGQLKYLGDIWYDSDHVRFVIPRQRIKFWKPGENKLNPTQDNFIMLLTEDLDVRTRFDHNFSEFGTIYSPLT